MLLLGLRQVLVLLLVRRVDGDGRVEGLRHLHLRRRHVVLLLLVLLLLRRHLVLLRGQAGGGGIALRLRLRLRVGRVVALRVHHAGRGVHLLLGVLQVGGDGLLVLLVGGQPAGLAGCGWEAGAGVGGGGHAV